MQRIGHWRWSLTPEETELPRERPQKHQLLLTGWSGALQEKTLLASVHSDSDRSAQAPPQRAPFIHRGENENSNLPYWRNTTEHARLRAETLSQSACRFSPSWLAASLQLQPGLLHTHTLSSLLSQVFVNVPSWGVTAAGEDRHRKSTVDLQRWSLSTSCGCLSWSTTDNKSAAGWVQDFCVLPAQLAQLFTKLLPWGQHPKGLVHKCKVILWMLETANLYFFFFFFKSTLWN